MGVGAYFLWGVLPIYFHVLAPSGPIEVLAHRVVWSLVACAALVALTRSWRQIGDVFRDGHALRLLTAASLLLAVNWLTYLYGVLTEQVVETALGYYINPLITVLLGVFVLKERLNGAQWIGLGIAAAAVAVMTISYGRFPWIAFTLAFSFAIYGLIKNRVGARVNAVHSLGIETLVLVVPAVAALVWLNATGRSTFLHHGGVHTALLMAAGIITSVPLLLFAGAARRIPLFMVGLLQYIAPTTQLFIGVVALHEPMTSTRLAGFVLVWIALTIFTLGSPAVRARLKRAR